MNHISATRFYGSSIALVSGPYSIISALTSALRVPMMEPAAGFGLSGLIMLVVGGAVFVHGVALLTPADGGRKPPPSRHDAPALPLRPGRLGG